MRYRQKQWIFDLVTFHHNKLDVERGLVNNYEKYSDVRLNIYFILDTWYTTVCS